MKFTLPTMFLSLGMLLLSGCNTKSIAKIPRIGSGSGSDSVVESSEDAIVQPLPEVLGEEGMQGELVAACNLHSGNKEQITLACGLMKRELRSLIGPKESTSISCALSHGGEKKTYEKVIEANQAFQCEIVVSVMEFVGGELEVSFPKTESSPVVSSLLKDAFAVMNGEGLEEKIQCLRDGGDFASCELANASQVPATGADPAPTTATDEGTDGGTDGTQTSGTGTKQDDSVNNSPIVIGPTPACGELTVYQESDHDGMGTNEFVRRADTCQICDRYLGNVEFSPAPASCGTGCTYKVIVNADAYLKPDVCESLK